MLRRRTLMKGETDYSLQYFTLKALSAGSFSHTNVPVDYSTDGGKTWTTLNAGSSTPTVQAGTKVMFRGTITPSTSYGVGTFTGTNNFVAEGNVMSLLYGDNFVGQVDLTGKNYAFYTLFFGASYLQDAKNLLLPATTLANYCYFAMFYNCTSLMTAPELPATTLSYGCYSEMFNGCTSLIVAPELPATTIATNCYGRMFYGCTSLTTAASELPATTLTDFCYYYMFYGCTSLTVAPEISAIYLSSSCCSYMFYNCSKLNYIKAMFISTPSSSYTGSWVSGVASSGTFVKNSAATWNVRGINGIPSRWTVQTASS